MLSFEWLSQLLAKRGFIGRGVLLWPVASNGQESDDPDGVKDYAGSVMIANLGPRRGRTQIPRILSINLESPRDWQSFNARIRAFRSTQRGVKDVNFFLFRLTKMNA